MARRTWKALVVGVTDNIVRLSSALDDYGIEDAVIWPTAEEKPLPAGIDAVVLLMDSAPSSAVLNYFRRECEKQKLMLAVGMRKGPMLDRALSLAGFYKRTPPETQTDIKLRDMLQPKPELPATEESEMPAETAAPPKPSESEKARWTFDELMGHLKATLKLMRDSHHVESVRWTREEGLKVTRKQDIDTGLDD